MPKIPESAEYVKRVVTPRELGWQGKWLAVEEVFNHYYYKLDLEALRIALSIYVAHTHLKEPPVWSFLVGPSSTGKSEIIRAVSCLPSTHAVDTIRRNSLLSGFGEKNGLLHSLHKRQGMLLMSDFSTFLHSHPTDRLEVQGQLRTLFDGYLSRPVGNKKESITWRGKVSILAACTPALERYWGLTTDLGERFLYVQMKYPQGKEEESKAMDMAIKQLGKEVDMRNDITEVIRDYVDVDSLEHLAVDSISKTNKAIARMISKVRQFVAREALGYGGKMVISGVDKPEMSGRLAKSLTQVATAHAMLNRRDSIQEEDLKLLRRVAVDTLPGKRWQIIYHLYMAEDFTLDIYALMQKTRLSRTALRYHLDNLEIMRVLNIQKGEAGGAVGKREKTEITLGNDMIEMIEDAFPAG